MKTLVVICAAVATGCMLFAERPATLDEIANRSGQDAMLNVKAVDEARSAARSGDVTAVLTYARTLIDANASYDLLKPTHGLIDGRDWPALYRECIGELDALNGADSAHAADALAWKGLLQAQLGATQEAYATIGSAYRRDVTSLSGVWYARTLREVQKRAHEVASRRAGLGVSGSPEAREQVARAEEKKLEPWLHIVGAETPARVDAMLDSVCRATRAVTTADADVTFLLDVCFYQACQPADGCHDFDLSNDPRPWISAADRRLHDHAEHQRDEARAEYETAARANEAHWRVEKQRDKQREIDRMVRERECAREGGASAKCNSTIDPLAR